MNVAVAVSFISSPIASIVRLAKLETREFLEFSSSNEIVTRSFLINFAQYIRYMRLHFR